MSKSRNQNRSELEYVRGQLKAVQRENRQLRKRLKALDKKAHFFESEVVDSAEDINIDLCSHCGKGVLQVLDLAHITLVTCNICEHRERIRPNEKKTK